MFAGEDWWVLAIGGLCLLFSFNAIRPHSRRATIAAASFFAGWLKGELVLLALILETLFLGVVVWQGALATWPGRVGAAALAGSLALLLVSLRQSLASREVIEEALIRFVRHERPPARLRWPRLLFPFFRGHGDVERVSNRVFHSDGGARLTLDIYRRRGADYGPAAMRPALIFVHGGAWIVGQKRQQGLPMLNRFAALGWVCFSIDYRLSPAATFPDHVVDVKRAIVWVRAHARELGVDPGFIVISGNSAGGHLASLAALTPNDPAFQPGFEGADTSVAACLSLYGVYDLGDRHGHWPNRGLQEILQRYVMKVRLSEAPERFDAASPIARLGRHAPPFLVVHGELDSVVPVAEAREFYRALQLSTATSCAYIEVPGAQHAFEVFPSVRTHFLLQGLERFAEHVHSEYRNGRAG
jgi:acetyl esterase/lipase